MSKALLNRDVGWLSWNQRVADESWKKIHTIGDRFLFSGISWSNIYEHLAVRYPAMLKDDPDSLEHYLKMLNKHWEYIGNNFWSLNKKYGLIKRISNLNKDSRKWCENYFKQNVKPALQPITVDADRKANIHNGMYVLIIAENGGDESIGYIEIPSSIDRFVKVPKKNCVVAIEDMVQSYIKDLIRGRKIIKTCAFSVIRSAEIYTQPDHYMDPYELVQFTLKERERSWVTCLETTDGSKKVRSVIERFIHLSDDTLIMNSRMVRLSDLTKIPKDVYKESDKPKSFTPYETWSEHGSIFSYIKKKDRLAFHPYESYQNSFVRFLEEAADDPDVVNIRITLYRVASKSRIIDALVRAADSGKMVTVLVELKARFDEKHNMQISQILKEAGVRIIYTRPTIKTHAKCCIIVRKEKKGLRIYSHVGTGNYNEQSAKLYTDYSYFTADQDIGQELVSFFNLLTSDQEGFKAKHIIYSPYNLKDEIADLIENQIKQAKKKKPAKIFIKCNALTDIGVAKKLMDAAESGVKIILFIRSACIIQPQKNIKVYSLAGRFLEHSRVYCFKNGKSYDVYIGSSDMMTRSLRYRNELLIKIDQQDLKSRILSHIRMYMKDTTGRRQILENYMYKQLYPKKKKKAYNAQAEFIKEAKKLSEEV